MNLRTLIRKLQALERATVAASARDSAEVFVREFPGGPGGWCVHAVELKLLADGRAELVIAGARTRA